MQSGAMAFHEELNDLMDNPMGFGASKRTLKHELHLQKNVTVSTATMELHSVSVNRGWDFKAAALLHDMTAHWTGYSSFDLIDVLFTCCMFQAF